jgi:Zn-dependent M28 family amino/carboxypeptidase
MATPPPVSADLTAMDRDIVAEVWTSDEAYENLVHLCDECGSRFAGTPGERAAVEFMAARLRAYGLENVRLEEVAYTGWVRGTTRLETLSPERRVIDCIALPYCPSGQVEGDLVFVGHGHPQDYADKAADLRGAVAMVSTKPPAFMRRGMHRMEKYFRALRAGAVAFIWMREEGGLLPETGSLTFNSAAPTLGVGVSKEAGSTLLRLAKKAPDGKVRVRLTAENVTRPMVTWNVIGDIPGRLRPERVLVMGGHFDGHDISQGALDDGAGAVVAMEAARALARHKGRLDRTIRVMCFPAEEIGLIGSHAYVDNNPGEVAKVEFMLNLDGAGRGGDTNLILQGWNELRGLFTALGKEMKQPLTVGSQISPYSDMFPFAMAGVPSATMSSAGDPRSGRGWGHTAADTLDKVSPRGLAADAMTVARLFLRLANIAEDRGWPARRRTPEELKALLAEQDLLEVLTIEGRYPFRD